MPFVIAVAAVALAASLIFVYRLSQQVDRLHTELEESVEREQRLVKRIDESGERLHEFRQRAEDAIDRAETESERARAAQIETDLAAWERELARQRAEDAERREAEAREAAREARAEADEARQIADEKEQLAEKSREAAERSRKEFERIRTARTQELNRMQQALSKIADTERTPLGMVMQLSENSLQFEFDDDRIRVEDTELLSRVAGVLLASHGYQIYIYGHTDDQGNAAYNEQLSERRAQAVLEYFAKAGVPRELMRAEGLGEKDPRAPGTSPEARQKNRRVEIGVVDTVIDYEREPASAAAKQR